MGDGAAAFDSRVGGFGGFGTVDRVGGMGAVGGPLETELAALDAQLGGRLAQRAPAGDVGPDALGDFLAAGLQGLIGGLGGGMAVFADFGALGCAGELGADFDGGLDGTLGGIGGRTFFSTSRAALVPAAWARASRATLPASAADEVNSAPALTFSPVLALGSLRVLTNL